jgi:hypothetical protein
MLLSVMKAFGHAFTKPGGVSLACNCAWGTFELAGPMVGSEEPLPLPLPPPQPGRTTESATQSVARRTL